MIYPGRGSTYGFLLDDKLARRVLRRVAETLARKVGVERIPPTHSTTDAARAGRNIRLALHVVCRAKVDAVAEGCSRLVHDVVGENRVEITEPTDLSEEHGILGGPV